MSVTIKQLAKELNLSLAAVSLALRGLPGVSEETRAKVLDTAKSMGYTRTNKPRASERNIIQLVIYKRHGKIFTDAPFFEPLMEGMSDQAASLGYRLTITYFYGTQDLQEQLRSIKTMNCAGMILLATEMQQSNIRPFLDLKIPVVVLDNFFPAYHLDSVEIDNECGARLAVEHLTSRGHIRLGYLHSKVDIRNFSLRKRGYLSGCSVFPEDVARDNARRIICVGNTPEQASADMHTFLREEHLLPTAFFADNDAIALGCCQALQRYGLRIPEDVSVIGFDDSSLCQMMEPQLTTMAVAKERMGALAVGRLHDRITQFASEAVRILIRPELVIRGTVLNRNG